MTSRLVRRTATGKRRSRNSKTSSLRARADAAELRDLALAAGYAATVARQFRRELRVGIAATRQTGDAATALDAFVRSLSVDEWERVIAAMYVGEAVTAVWSQEQDAMGAPQVPPTREDIAELQAEARRQAELIVAGTIQQLYREYDRARKTKQGESPNFVRRLARGLYRRSFTRTRAGNVAAQAVLQATSQVQHQAQRAVARVTGGRVVREWTTVRDGRVRDVHAAADGRREGVDGYFIVGGEKLRRPRDPAGSAWNVINCRCSAPGIVVGGASTEEGAVTLDRGGQAARDDDRVGFYEGHLLGSSSRGEVADTLQAAWEDGLLRQLDVDQFVDPDLVDFAQNLRDALLAGPSPEEFALREAAKTPWQRTVERLRTRFTHYETRSKTLERRIKARQSWVDDAIELATEADNVPHPGLNKISREAALRRFEKAWSDNFDDAVLSVRMGSQATQKFIKDGRTKNIFHRGAKTDWTRNKAYRDHREGLEELLFDLVGAEPDARPTYGYLWRDVDTDAPMTDMYGEFRLVFNDDVKARSSFTWGDSLDNHWEDKSPLVPGMVRDGVTRHNVPWDKSGVNPGIFDGDWDFNPWYVETQTWGAVTPDDVVEVIANFPSRARIQRFTVAGEDRLIAAVGEEIGEDWAAGLEAVREAFGDRVKVKASVGRHDGSRLHQELVDLTDDEITELLRQAQAAREGRLINE